MLGGNKMNFLLIAEADAAATEAANAAMGGMSWFTIIWLVVIVAFFYFFMIRPQKKKEKEAHTLSYLFRSLGAKRQNPSPWGPPHPSSKDVWRSKPR